MAETEISIMGSQCLDRRLESQGRMAEEVTAWESERNAREARIHWTLGAIHFFRFMQRSLLWS
jgi:hypothetical protein